MKIRIIKALLYIYNIYIYTYIYVCMYVPVLVFLEILCHLLDQVNYSKCQQYPV